MTAITVVSFSIILQLAASILALRLIPLTGRRRAWIMISLALLLMALRRCITVYEMVFGAIGDHDDLSVELVALLTSLLMLIGIIWIGPLFRTIKNSAEALRESEERYRTIFEDSKDVIFVSSREGRFIDINPAARELFGYTVEEMIGMETRKIYANVVDRSAYQQKIEMEGAVKDYPVTFLKKDGSRIDCLMTATVQRTADGTPVGYRGIIRDITQLKRTMDMVEADRRRLFSVLASIPAFVVLRAPDASLVLANRRFREAFGDPKGRHCHEVFNQLGELCVECPALRVFETGVPEQCEKTGLDGRIYQVYLCPFADVDGSSHVLLLGIDITERKRAEEERVRLVTAIEQVAEGVIITNADSTITYVNPAFERLNGYMAKEVLGLNLGALGNEDADQTIYKGLQSCLSNAEAWAGHSMCRRKDGSQYEVEATISPVRNESGAVINCVILERDVTRESKLESQLRQAQKMEAIGTLAGGIAHDFNNTLSAILGFTELALLQASVGNEAKAYLRDVLKSVDRAKALVKQILDFSRQSEQVRKPIQISTIVNEVIKMLRASLPSTIEIQHDVTSKRMVLADPTQIHQVLMNLCTNGAHAMRAYGGILKIGLIDVELDSDFAARYPGIDPGPHIRLTVSDTGHGMDAATIERIFDPYFTTKGAGEGTGLGLSVVHGIIKSYGGAITVYSVPGEGSTFQVLLPAIEDQELIKAETTSFVPSGTERILLVDDEPSLVRSGAEILEALGYVAAARTSAVDALKAFRAQPDKYDLVITDLTMPQMTGVDLAKKLLSIKPGIPIILCTGFSEVLTPEKAKMLGIRNILMKPWTIREMALAIRSVLDTDNTRRQE
jgi:PAS domain S-box-containing protein